MTLDTGLVGAIEAAKELFWVRGYDETSIDDLVEATGMNRYALYGHFGGKRELFLAALENYFDERRVVFFSVLSDPTGGPMDAIRQVAEYSIEKMTERGAGCMVLNVAVELGRQHPEIAECADKYLNEMRAAMERALVLARDHGELNPAIDPKVGAALLIAVMMGGGAMARNGASRDELVALFEANLVGMRRTAPVQHRSHTAVRGASPADIGLKYSSVLRKRGET